MRYVTESLAEALYQARKNRMEEAPEVKKVNESEEAPEVKKTINESEEEDFTDVDDREPEADDEEAVDDAIDESAEVINEEEKEDESEDSEEVDEARWVTMKNKNHALIDNDGSVLAGGDPKTRKKVSRKEIEAAAKSAGSK